MAILIVKRNCNRTTITSQYKKKHNTHITNKLNNTNNKSNTSNQFNNNIELENDNKNKKTRQNYF